MGIYKDIKKTQDEIATIETEYEKASDECRKRARVLMARDAKKKGNIWLLLGVSAMVIGSVLTTGVLGSFGLVLGSFLKMPGSTALLIGIVIKICGINEFKEITSYDFNEEDLRRIPEVEKERLEFGAQRKKLEEELEKAKAKLNSLVQYNRLFDLENFKATPDAIRALEEDTEKLYAVVQYYGKQTSLPIKGFNWMYTGGLVDTEGFWELGKSGSWKLRVTQIVLLSLNKAKGNILGHTDRIWEEAKEEINVRAAKTGEEEEYYWDAFYAARIMGDNYEMMEHSINQRTPFQI